MDQKESDNRSKRPLSLKAGSFGRIRAAKVLVAWEQSVKQEGESQAEIWPVLAS
jgi:hypothetical protein